MREPRVLLRSATLALFALLALASAAIAAGCPTNVRFVPDATGPTLDAGWSGIAHDVPILGTTLHLGTSCAASTPPCGTCTITGAVADPAGSSWRCSTDTAITCSVATEVAACGAPGTCRYYLSPPQSLATGGIAFCATLEADGAMSGTVGVESGALTVTVPVRTIVNEGVLFIPQVGDPNQGCPRCNGDATANDGVRGGTCDAGPRQGLACDANAVAPFVDFGSTSLDCPPAPANQSLLTTRPLTLSTTPQGVTLTADSPLCNGTPWTSSPCFCATCNDLAAGPCASNADCPPSGGNPGICGGKRCSSGSNAGTPCKQNSECPGAACSRPGTAAPHACFDDTVNPDDCSPDDDGGVCNTGPVDTYCADHPNRGCTHNVDCDDVPGGCRVRFRPCFRDNGVLGGSVTVGGTATPPVDDVSAPTTLGALTCARPGIDPFVNVWGLPGLVRLRQPGTLLFDATDLSPCPASPAACRTPVLAHKASLDLRDRSPDDRDQLAWKWDRGAATTVPELGDPLTTTEYVLCLYDAAGLRATMRVGSGGTCGTRPCWQQRSTGFRYRNKAGTPDGIVDLALKAGADGKGQMQVKGKGLALPMPPLSSLTTTLQVQLRNRTSGLCWGATYSPPFQSVTAERLKAKAD